MKEVKTACIILGSLTALVGFGRIAQAQSYNSVNIPAYAVQREVQRSDQSSRHDDSSSNSNSNADNGLLNLAIELGEVLDPATEAAHRASQKLTSDPSREADGQALRFIKTACQNPNSSACKAFRRLGR